MAVYNNYFLKAVYKTLNNKINPLLFTITIFESFL